MQSRKIFDKGKRMRCSCLEPNNYIENNEYVIIYSENNPLKSGTHCVNESSLIENNKCVSDCSTANLFQFTHEKFNIFKKFHIINKSILMSGI